MKNASLGRSSDLRIDVAVVAQMHKINHKARVALLEGQNYQAHTYTRESNNHQKDWKRIEGQVFRMA